MVLLRSLLFFSLLAISYVALGQQDMDLHLSDTFLPGKNILKVKRDFKDPYLWVLVQNNEVYRINSLTKVVDNYTVQFTAYSAFQFIDIAGVSKDQVFIATSSANMLEYKSGIIKVIGTAAGIPGTVNSIGIDHTGSYLTDHTYGGGGHLIANTVLIATDNGMCHYDYDNEVILPYPSHVHAKVFETTYRTEMFSDEEFGIRTYPDGSQTLTYPVIELTYQTIYGGYLWLEGGKYGHTIKTAYYTPGDAYMPDSKFSLYANHFWATETGMFQVYWDQSYAPDATFATHRYLDGLSISKITSIYGLLSFGHYDGFDPIKENLLVGSSQGLYFSNSKYKKQYGADYTFYHYDDLGNKAINDICVNANSYETADMGQICEDGIWVAAADGLYLIKPDYAPYVDQTKSIAAIHFEGKSNTISELQLCSDIAAKAVVNDSYYQGNLIQWYKDGQELPNESNRTLNITQAGEYHAILYDPCSVIHFESNHLKVTKISAPVFTFNYPDKASYCDGSTAVLKTEENALYQYRWYKDGVLNGNTTAILNTTESGKYKIEVSACDGTWVPSKEVEVDFVKIPNPTIAADRAAYCLGDQAKLTATVPIDASQLINWTPYQYRWYKDGVLTAGTNVLLTITAAGKYKVEITDCSGNWLASNELQVSFITLVKPVIAASKPSYCIGDDASLSVNFVNDGNYTLNWLLNGSVLQADKNKTTISASQAGNYSFSISNNLTTCSVLSDEYKLSFDVPPTISIQQITNTTLCDGETISLKATYSSGSLKWSTGETTGQINVKRSGTYSATANTVSGCTASQDVLVQFLPNPILAVPDATLCQFTSETITLSAPTGFAKYEWNGQAGNSTFSTNKLGQVSLTVTDNNGCKASQTIKINSHCDDIHIPNVFSPNGDGVNDTWTISGLEDDQTALVRVYNRIGTLLFQSYGYATPWAGNYNGHKLPAGVYYYVINARGAKQVLSGSVSIIY